MNILEFFIALFATSGIPKKKDLKSAFVLVSVVSVMILVAYFLQNLE